MAKVKDIRQALETAVRDHEASPELASDLSTFFTNLARHDDMSVASFFQMMTRADEPADRDTVSVDALVQALRGVFASDDGFRAELKRIQSDKKVSREALNGIYEALSGRVRKLPAKATKAKLAQDIADLRLERVRSERAAEMFAGKPVFAE
ncbi:MAG: hypothetical protein JNM59_05175 [Hyphomonadaceae bacterium]|nr:hypothetical protein [Hyphomonadaceae bacterium]